MLSKWDQCNHKNLKRRRKYDHRYERWHDNGNKEQRDRRERMKQRSERREDAMLLGLKIEEGSMSQRMQAASRGKDRI